MPLRSKKACVTLVSGFARVGRNIETPTTVLRVHTRAHRYGCKVCAVYGGAGKWEMQKALKEGPEIVVATPGRMIEMIKLKATNMRRCTMMVRRKVGLSVSWIFCLCGARLCGWLATLARGARFSCSRKLVERVRGSPDFRQKSADWEGFRRPASFLFNAHACSSPCFRAFVVSSYLCPSSCDEDRLYHT